jgi:hypothetical protein
MDEIKTILVFNHEMDAIQKGGDRICAPQLPGLFVLNDGEEIDILSMDNRLVRRRVYGIFATPTLKGYIGDDLAEQCGYRDEDDLLEFLACTLGIKGSSVYFLMLREACPTCETQDVTMREEG